jgi:hypothetical protein
MAATGWKPFRGFVMLLLLVFRSVQAWSNNKPVCSIPRYKYCPQITRSSAAAAACDTSTFCATRTVLWMSPSQDQQEDPAAAATEASIINSSNKDQRQTKLEEAQAQASALRQSALKARLEAEQLESMLVLQKISSLEQLLQQAMTTTNNNSAKKQEQLDEISQKIKQLKEQLEPKEETKQASPVIDDPSNKAKEEGVSKEDNSSTPDANDSVVEQRELVKDLSEDDQKAISDLRDLFSELIDVEVTSEIDAEFQSLNALLGNATSPPKVTENELSAMRFALGVVSFFEKFFNLTTSTKEERKEEALRAKEDPLYREKTGILAESFSAALFKRGNKPDKEIADMFVDQILNDPAVFVRASNARVVGDAYIVEGRNQQADGDALISALQQKMAQSSNLQNKIRFFYIRDPTILSEMDDVQIADMIQPGEENNVLDALSRINEMEPGAILLTGPDVSPETEAPIRFALSALGLGSLAIFSGSCYTYSSDASIVDSFLAGVASPIFWSILATQLAHELAHWIAALVGKVRWWIISCVTCRNLLVSLSLSFLSISLTHLVLPYTFSSK